MPERRWGSFARDWVLGLLLATTACVMTVTMPKLLYTGDSDVPRAECANLIRTGRLGLSYEAAGELDAYRVKPGGYFHENEGRRRVDSKFGLAYTLLYLPPLLAERWVAGDVGLLSRSASLVMFLSVYQILLSLVVVAYLYGLACLFTKRRGCASLFVLGSVFASYAWFYLRNSALEIFQMVGFAGAAFHTLSWMRAESEGVRKVALRHAILQGVWITLLVLMKGTYLLAIPIGIVLAVRWRCERVGSGVRVPKTSVAGGAALVSWGIAVVLLLGSNWARFGSPLEFGYGQWEVAPGIRADRFSLSFLALSLPAFLFKLGNQNLFVHHPLLLFSLLAWPVFARRHARAAGWLGGLFLVMVLCTGCFSNWHGIFGYGPRYLLPVVLAASLPVVLVWEWLAERMREGVGLTGGLVMLFVLLISVELQLSMIALDGYAYYHLRRLFDPERNPELTRYFEEVPHRALINNALLAHVNYGEEFKPMRLFEAGVGKDSEAKVICMRAALAECAQLNWMFAGSVHGVRSGAGLGARTGRMAP